MKSWVVQLRGNTAWLAMFSLSAIQKKMEGIREDLRQPESSLREQVARDKSWIPAKIALFLDQGSK